MRSTQEKTKKVKEVAEELFKERKELYKKLAKKASLKEAKILEDLESYYKGECSLGYTASKLKMPLRALMGYMTKQGLPQYWEEEDRKRGLKRISEIRSAL